MASLTIRCRPCVPVPIAELESWLARRLEELRAELPELRVRLLRLTQPLPSDDIEVGWLLELELPGDQCAPIEPRLHATVTDMRLLGLQPTLLQPGTWRPGTHGPPKSASRLPAPGRRQPEPAGHV
jgi:hypothetical protein